MERNLEYEENNIAYDCQYREEDGGGIKCKNFIICETVLPKWWFDCKAHYLCTNCDIMFGNKRGKGMLKVKDVFECPLCLEVKQCVSQPRCDHYVCVDCFKRCYYGDENREGEPKFPYPDIEDEYDDDQDNPKWETEYPSIEIYNEQHSIWDDEKMKKYENEEYLRMCPICRK